MKSETLFFCKECGNDFPRWSGQCGTCGAWNSLVEEKARNSKSEIRNSQLGTRNPQQPVSINKIGFNKEDRLPTGISELDRVLGGGIVAGSVTLVGGDPGIGKSTLMLQAANSVENTLYVSGEESGKQIRMRAERLSALSQSLKILTETNIIAIEKAIAEEKPALAIIDSIQTMFREDIDSAAGSVSQVRECAAYLTNIAKTTHVPIIIIGHVTKEGNIAGPRLLEHIVDTVLYFEGEQHKHFRVLRAVKNRFGSISETGIFEMKDNGLQAVKNPSELFLSERSKDSAGSAVTATIEGTRPLLVEVQALVAPTKMMYPTRKVSGVDFNRASIIIAVLERHLGLKLASQDIYINAAGGVKVSEPATDLAVAAAIASSYKNKPIPSDTVIIGEVGLAGEVRSISQIEQRLKEAENLGFKKAIIPQGNLKHTNMSGLNITGANTILEAVKASLL